MSLTGPGGLGKTRLAHAVARSAAQRVVHFVELAGVTRDGDVTGEVAAALGLGENRRVEDPVLGILDVLGPGSALLVLDNCEQVVDGVAALVRDLVARTAELRVLTTTRAPLGLSSESVYLLPELDPDTAVALFRARAAAARPDVELPPDAVAEVCRHLDGLPLAVELAAARVRVMSVPEISRGLRDRFALLRGGPRDAPERHRTLLAVVDWSWNLLDDDGRAAMRALSVFPGGFSAAAASAVVGAGALDVLEHLVDQSLLKVADTAAGTRFRMLEAVRELGAARLAEAGGTQDAIGRFLDWARAFGVAHVGAPFGPAPAAPVERMRVEQDNLVQALRLAVGRADAATVTAVVAVLASLWTVESNYVRMSALSGEPEWLLSHYRPGPDMVETTRSAAALLTTYAFVLDQPRATRSLAVLHRLPPAPPDTALRAITVLLTAPPGSLDDLAADADPLVAGTAVSVRSYARASAGDLAGAAADAERALAAFTRATSPLLHVIAMLRVAELHMQTDRGADALAYYEAALRVPGLPRNWPEVLGLRDAAVLASLQAGALDEAQELLDSAAGGGPEDVTFGSRSFELGVRGELQLARGDVDAGLGLWRAALEVISHDEASRILQEPGLEPWLLELGSVAVVAHARAGRPEPVEDTVAALERVLPRLLADEDHSTVLYAGLPLCGAILVALGTTDIARGDARSGVRLIALAERFSFLRQFAPTMSGERVRADAERADGPAYAEAVSAYAGLPAERLRDAAREAIAQRVRANSDLAQR